MLTVNNAHVVVMTMALVMFYQVLPEYQLMGVTCPRLMFRLLGIVAASCEAYCLDQHMKRPMRTFNR